MCSSGTQLTIATKICSGDAENAAQPITTLKRPICETYCWHTAKGRLDLWSGRYERVFLLKTALHSSHKNSPAELVSIDFI